MEDQRDTNQRRSDGAADVSPAPAEHNGEAREARQGNSGGNNQRNNYNNRRRPPRPQTGDSLAGQTAGKPTGGPAGADRERTQPAVEQTRPAEQRNPADRPQGAQDATRPPRTVWSSSKKRPSRPTAPAVQATPPAGRPVGTPTGAPTRAPALATGGQTAQRQAAPAGRENGASGAHAATQRMPGQRPPRMPHRAPRPAELPQMDDLLIEDCPVEDNATGADRNTPDTAELDRILNAQICTPQSQRIPRIIPEGKVVIVGVRFRTGGKTYFFAPGKLTCTVGQHAIVETAAGLEFGEVCIGNRMVDESLVVQPLRPVVRIATPQDIDHNRENHEREVEAYRIGIEKILAHKLDMKLVSVQYTFDNSKLLFYFTSAGRVDFRELVKDLAGVFHIRIELRQIGIRDEARMVGGLGACGRPLCCNTFLSDFGQVSMKMAKEQNLSLNSSKISGCCGRLMCCLRFEYDTYVEEIRRTPAPGSLVNTPDGPGVVTEILPLLGEVKVSLRNMPDSAPKKFKREDVTPQAPLSRPGDAESPVRPARPARPSAGGATSADRKPPRTPDDESVDEPDEDL